MPKPYMNRLIANQTLLNHPQQKFVQESCDSLFELWLTYSSDKDFVGEVRLIADKHLFLSREFVKRVGKLRRTEEEKASLIKNIKSSLPALPIKIFISYSHKDETFKNELIIMLDGLQRRRVIDAWQDRRIEAGYDWFAAIEKAMEECEIAVLLVSPDFLASRFIQEVELNHFFQRRIKEGLRVVPIIIRYCLWDSEPVIKDLQALPKDGEPVISFSKDNGDRDKVWTDISKAIENIAKSL